MLLMGSMTASSQQLAFPGAQGWGRFATGARNGGSVYHVTNLNDSGTGSLRDAVSQPNRIVVFDVAGVIRINSRIIFSKNLYVAGQTAPGEGVTVYGDGVSFSGADNIIVRYMRFRMGAVGSKDRDAGGIANGQNMIFDHCSFSWGQDENFSVNWDNKGTAPKNITLMNSIVGQGLMTHSAGGLMQGENISLYRILLVDNSTRNFKVKGVNQYANNIVYNWKNYAYNMGGDSEGESFANIESNLFVNGPDGGGNCLDGGNAKFHFYGADNWQDANRDGILNPTEFTGNGGGDRQSQPYDYPALEKWSARDLIDKLIPEVGASLPYRDLADCYMVDEVLSFGKKGKLITNENELPIGVPTQWTMFAGTKPTDTDNDGMPDWWEEANGTNKNANDAMTKADNGYANIENYINSITKADREFFLRAPLLLELTSSTPNSLTLAWADYTEDEDGFIVEIKQNGQFVEVGRTANSQFSILKSQFPLQPASTYVVRVCAYKGDQKSAYTSELTVKTRPEQTDLIDVDAFTGEGEGEWLINPTDDQTITLTEPTPKTAVVVKSDAHVTIDGTGYISGSASMNKAGNGTLTIASNQYYEGATVLHGGVYEFSTLKDGEVPSGLGKSQEFAQNWVMDGGTYRYIGSSTSTNRSARLYDATTFAVATKNTNVTMNGSIEGSGDLIIDGEGIVGVNTPNFFKFNGNVVMRGGLLKLNYREVSEAGIGTASKLIMQGGTFTTVGKNEGNITYNFPIEVPEGSNGTVDFDLWNSNKCKVSGQGTLTWNVHYVREYIEGNWDSFTGKLIVRGTGNAGSSQFAIRNGTGIKNATLQLKGNAAIHGAKTNSTYYLGGLSGDASTFLAGFDVKTAGKGTWVVGGANTDETFRGVINDYDQKNSHPGTTNIEKQGSGDWRLTGANTYSGTTVVGKGRLIVNGNHSGTGAVTVRSGATLAGRGYLKGAVTIQNGGILQVGDTLASEKGLTFNGGLKLLNGAILQLNDKMAAVERTAGSSIKVFTVTGTATGTFAEIIPATPGEGLRWDTSEINKGVLKVVADADNIQSLRDLQPESRTYHTLSGEQVTKPIGRGVYLMTTHSDDGRVVSKKIYIK